MCSIIWQLGISFVYDELDDHNFTFMRAGDYSMNDPGKTLNGLCLVTSSIPTKNGL